MADIIARGMADAIGRIPNTQTWIANEGQTVFTLGNGSYIPNRNLLTVIIDSVPQISGEHYTETNSTSFTLTEPLSAGTKVYAKWYEVKVPETVGHGSRHETGGSDEIDITKLKNYDVISSSLSDKATQLNSQYLNVKYPFGTGLTALKGDGTDETAAILAFINYAKTRLPMTLFFPNGAYGYTDLGSNIAYSGLSIVGATDRGVILKCLNTAVGHTALNLDAFYSGQVVGFVQKCNLKNIIVEGNSETEIIVNVQGIARSSWENVYARTGKANTTSKGFAFKGVMLSSFKNLMCSTQLDTMSSVPYYGIHLDEGIRAGSTVGHASNNTFTSCYFEGLSTGIYLYKADQNTFIGGSPENCTNIGLLVTATSLYNTFIGTGFENSAATLDIDDGGLSTQYINCYSNNYVKLRGQASKIEGGMYNNIEVMPTAVHCKVENVKVRHWGGSVGFVIDTGATGTKFRGIYDEVTLTFKYPTPARVGITVGASPFTWTNNTGNLAHVYIGGGGTVSSIQSIRNGGDPYNLSVNSLPAMYTIPPNDGLTVTYTVAPSMSYRELNGY